MNESSQRNTVNEEELPFVVLLATTGGKQLRETLNSLAQATLPSSFRGLFLIQNGSPTLTLTREDVPASLKPHLLHEPRGNKSAALNVALKAIQAQLGDAWVFMTDDDGDYPRDILTAYEERVQRLQGRYYLGGAIVPRYENKPADWLLELGPPSLRGFDFGQEERELPGASFCGHNWMARLRDMVEAGGFREDRGPGTTSTGQESAMMRDLRAVGCTPHWIPGIGVGHDVPDNACSPDWLVRRASRMGREQGLLQLEGRPRTAWRRTKARIKTPWIGLRAALAAFAGREREALRLRVRQARLRAFTEVLAERGGQ